MKEDGFSVTGDGLGGALLRAGRDDWPSDEALSRTLAAVAAGTAAAVVTGGAAASAGASVGTAAKGGVALFTFGSFVKWLGVGAASGALVAGVAYRITPPAPAPIHSSAVAPQKPAAAELRGEREPEPAPARAPEAAVTAESEPSKPAAPPRFAPHEPSGAAEREAPLAAEVALVDRARAALANGKPALALEELSRYESAFPEPRLEPEVLFLRMEAYLAAGNAPRAREVAEESLRLFPRSPHAARARQVMESGAEKKE